MPRHKKSDSFVLYLATPAQVRRWVHSRMASDEQIYATLDRLALELGITRRLLQVYVVEGIAIDGKRAALLNRMRDDGESLEVSEPIIIEEKRIKKLKRPRRPPLEPQVVEEIRARLARGARGTSLAQEYGISQSIVSLINQGKR
ncbi:hypothetical protein IAD21_02432 [Abditibacteriota bacterium]|nr:hypothetical protein IAD21_02432 [Abditibacteriota bacterium]